MQAYSLVKLIKSTVRKNYSLSLLHQIYAEGMIRLSMLRGTLSSDSGSTHAKLDLDASVAYIEEVFEDYKRYGNLTHFFGRVAEVGPGGNAGVALLILNDGADSVDLVDRFYSLQNHDQQGEIYKTLAERHHGIANFIPDGNFCAENFANGINRYYGEAAAAEIFFERNTGYDLIVSRAVLEHVYGPLRALRAMNKALSPGGLMLHKVDLRDHERFTPEFDELEWFEVPDVIYPWISGSGQPNRVTLGHYRRVLADIGLQCRFLVTHLAGQGSVEPHLSWESISPDKRAKAIEYVRQRRCRFAPSLASEADEDLAVSGFFLIAKKQM